MARVSVNILNTNEKHCLPRCIDAVLAQTWTDFEITVIDNASTDGSPEWVEINRPMVRLIRNPANLFYCGGHNVGIDQTDSEYVLLLNSDVFIEREFLSRMMNVMTVQPRLGGVQGKLWKIKSASAEPPPPDQRWIDTTGVIVTWSRRNFDRYQESFDRGQFDQPGPVFGPDGSAPLYRRAMLDDIRVENDYFDDDFLIYRDVVDLSWRARIRGWEFAYVPSATGYHVRGFSPRTRHKQPLFFRKLSYRNRYLTLIKNETWDSLKPHFWRFIGFEVAMLGHVLLREPSLISAWFDLFGLLPNALKKRKQIQAGRKTPNRRITQDFLKAAPKLHGQTGKNPPAGW